MADKRNADDAISPEFLRFARGCEYRVDPFHWCIVKNVVTIQASSEHFSKQIGSIEMYMSICQPVVGVDGD